MPAVPVAHNPMKNIAILGSTGSIGRSALGVVAANRGAFRIAALTANHNHELLARQIEEFRPEVVAVPIAASDLPGQPAPPPVPQG